jgi:hypothetical protein
MSGDDAASRLTKANRVSIRAVLVPIGEDVGKVLVEHGILDPISIPFAFANESRAPLGDSLIPDVIATLELDETGSTASAADGQRPAPGFLNLPKALPPPTVSRPGPSAAKTLAPVRKLPRSRR